MRLWSHLALRRLRRCLALLLLVYFPICRAQRWRSLYVVIGCKRLVDGHESGAAMIRIGKLPTVGGSSALILELRLHGRSVRLMHCRELGWPSRHPDTARSTVVTHM